MCVEQMCVVHSFQQIGTGISTPKTSTSQNVLIGQYKDLNQLLVVKYKFATAYYFKLLYSNHLYFTGHYNITYRGEINSP